MLAGRLSPLGRGRVSVWPFTLRVIVPLPTAVTVACTWTVEAWPTGCDDCWVRVPWALIPTVSWTTVPGAGPEPTAARPRVVRTARIGGPAARKSRPRLCPTIARRIRALCARPTTRTRAALTTTRAPTRARTDVETVRTRPLGGATASEPWLLPTTTPLNEPALSTAAFASAATWTSDRIFFIGMRSSLRRACYWSVTY